MGGQFLGCLGGDLHPLGGVNWSPGGDLQPPGGVNKCVGDGERNLEDRGRIGWGRSDFALERGS